MRMVVSAGRLFPWQAWYFARASAHLFPAIQACVYFLKEDVGLRVSDSISIILRRSPWTW